jgi:hypothetical protein
MLLCCVLLAWMGALDPTMFAGAWWRDEVGMRKARGTCGQRSSTAMMRCHKIVYPTAHADDTSDSKQQLYSYCSCQPGTKHLTYLVVGTANHGDTTLNCRARSRRGSSWHRVVYDLCDAEQLSELCVVEAHSLDRPVHVVEYVRVRLCKVSQRWRAVFAAPGGLATTMHGRRHSTILFTKANNCNTSLAERRLKDQLYAQQVRRQGWSVVWGWVVACISTKSALTDVCRRSKAVGRQW